VVAMWKAGVNEAGERLSQLELRSILFEPDWLLLDEVTASLDEPSERQVYTLIRERLPRATIVIVGHRSTLRALHCRSVDIGQRCSPKAVPYVNLTDEHELVAAALKQSAGIPDRYSPTRRTSVPTISSQASATLRGRKSHFDETRHSLVLVFIHLARLSGWGAPRACPTATPATGVPIGKCPNPYRVNP
jgi:hypothetical protein